jgi:alkanesulfonate monooxygenase SsuD/methylene tetrahydromethanopterin reductase-like flavin-dependent oxidoreductase (luciferase family)
MASNRKRKKDNEEEKTLIERLLEEEELKEEGTGIPKAAPGDVLPSPQQPMMQQGGGGGGSSFLGTILPMAAKIGMGYLTGGASAAGTGIPLIMEEGGQIKKKTKKKNKRYVRGVGAAKRGYGKATYSKKMY